MNTNLLWRSLLVVSLVAIALLSAYPPTETINLGLDLRGGIHLVLEVQTDDALRAEADKDMDRLLQELEDSGIANVQAERSDENSFEVRGVPVDQGDQVQSIVDDYLNRWDWRRQGEQLVFTRRLDEITQIEGQAVRQALQTIRNRIDAFGVAEPVIQRQGIGGKRIVVQLPGVDDPERVKRLIKNTAFLDFRLVDFPPPGRLVIEQREILDYYGGTLPSNLEILNEDRFNDQGQVTGRSYYALQKRGIITGRDLKTATTGLGQFNQPVVHFTLTPDGAKLFAQATGDNIGRGLAIVLDGKVQSAPEIQARIADRGIIEGSFTQQEVEDLVTTLRSGALPAGITYLEERTVGPTLGQDSIDQGLRAFMVGGVLVVLAMLMVYRLSGTIAVLALGLNVILVFGCLAYFGATLTLPGIAGIILTIGMAVDANVLVFERIKEELRGGRTVKSAVASGFGKALSSILDANVTTLIAAMFLFQFGTGPIRGFAVTLSVGILASVFTAVFNSRLIYDLFLSRRARVERLYI
jgi:preprotein translocase subunit SecD